MFLKNVYIGYNKNGKECLLYMVHKDYKDEKLNTYFIDLRDYTFYRMNDIDMNNLISFSKLVNGKKIMSKKKVINVYSVDRNKIIKIKNLFYADICKKTKGYYRKNSAPIVLPCTIEHDLGKNVLVEKVYFEDRNTSKVYYKNLYTGEIYSSEIDFDKYNVPFVTNLRNVDHSNRNVKVTKRKVLEKSYKENKV